MNENQIQVSRKQVKFFLAIVVVVVLGAIGVMLKISSGDNNQASSNPKRDKSSYSQTGIGEEFLGEEGETLQTEGDKVYIEERKVNDGQIHAFNYYSKKEGKNIYFFVVKASDGSYRAAANACEVCFDSKKGFRQIGDQIRCENCRTMYSKDQIALQKGGCNPRPIDKNVEVVNGRLAIKVADIEKTADLF